jgi:cytochrome c
LWHSKGKPKAGHKKDFRVCHKKIAGLAGTEIERIIQEKEHLMRTTKILATATLLSAFAAPVLASSDGIVGDAALGEKTYKKCAACHQVGLEAKNRAGPVLNGIVGNPAGQNPDYKYSKAMKKAAEDGLVWDVESLTAFLTKPKSYMKGTKMGFPGFKKEDDIANIIAYLATFE